jgi:hypothetical protein
MPFLSCFHERFLLPSTTSSYPNGCPAQGVQSLKFPGGKADDCLSCIMGDNIRAASASTYHFSAVTWFDFDIVNRISIGDGTNRHDIPKIAVFFATCEFHFVTDRGPFCSYHQYFFVILHSDLCDWCASTGIMNEIFNDSFCVPVVAVLDVPSVFV